MSDFKKFINQLNKKTVLFWEASSLSDRAKWVPVTTAWRVLRLRIEERTPIWRVAANILISSREQPTRGGPAPSQEKSDDSKDSVHEDLEQVLDHFPK